MRNASILMALLAIAMPLTSPAQEAAVSEEFMAVDYHIDSEASWLRVLAYPDGPLKRFGHHHVISHTDLSGNVRLAPDFLDSTVTLEFDVTDFVVDDAELRALEGENFEKEVKQKDKDGTKANMLGEKLLAGEQFPIISIQSTAIEGSLSDATVVATVDLKGMEKTVRFPVSIELRDDSFTAVGQLEIVHSDLGLSPFKAAGGALSVRDLLVLKYELSGSLLANSE